MTQRNTRVLEAVVLAAGQGARFGGDKLLAALDGAPLVAHALATAFASPARRVFVTVGQDARLRAAAEATAARLDATGRLVLVTVENPMAGMGASLAAGIAALPTDAEGAFVFLGDMPRVDPATPARLVPALTTPDMVVTPTFQGRRGHPVLFGAGWFAALRALRGDEGARALLESAGACLARVPLEDPGIHLDVDRPEDLTRAVEAR